jgi:hypothetical protein
MMARNSLEFGTKSLIFGKRCADLAWSLRNLFDRYSKKHDERSTSEIVDFLERTKSATFQPSS